MYIDREKLIDDILHALLVVPNEDFLLPPERDILRMIKSEPAADVREVVLCRDCVHNKGQKEWADGDITADCTCGIGYPPLDWFCAYGEKRSADMKGEADGT